MSVISPNDERVAVGFRDAEAQHQFWEAHSAEFVQKYPDEFVAVVDGVVVDSAADLQQLFYALRGKGIDPSRAWVRFMASRPRQMIL